jgi:DNA segregation ATPase FtsK/SpoIIIE-like protein
MKAGRGVDLVLLVVLGIGSALNGTWMLLDAAGWFARVAADVAPFNVHFVRDVGAGYLATGAALLAAALRPAWRVPLVATATIFHGLHALGHVRETASGELGSFHWLEDLPGVYLPALVMLALLVVYARRKARA